MNIGILSDTHGWIHPRLYNFFENVDEIWHAGDIGGIEVLDLLSDFKPMRAVYGNIDNAEVRSSLKEHLHFRTEKISVWMTHIGGVPGNYDRRVKEKIYKSPPDIFICGHSHIAKVMFDKKAGCLYVNPGAAGYNGFHKYMTAIRVEIDGKNIHDMELIELGERGKYVI